MSRLFWRTLVVAVMFVIPFTSQADCDISITEMGKVIVTEPGWWNFQMDMQELLPSDYGLRLQYYGAAFDDLYSVRGNDIPQYNWRERVEGFWLEFEGDGQMDYLHINLNTYGLPENAPSRLFFIVVDENGHYKGLARARFGYMSAARFDGVFGIFADWRLIVQFDEPVDINGRLAFLPWYGGRNLGFSIITPFGAGDPKMAYNWGGRNQAPEAWCY